MTEITNTLQEVETSMHKKLQKNEALVLEEKKKRRSCASATKESLVKLNELLNRITNSEEGVSVSAKTELGG